MALSRPILLMVSKVYVPVLFPLAFAMVWGGRQVDRALGWEMGLPLVARWGLAAVMMAAGLWVVGVSYANLVELGGGSPAPVAGRTRHLVIRGPYAHCRNPSVWGKLLGVLAVGLAVGSPAFCFAIVPLALALSLIEKVIRQEPQLVASFGKEYETYRDNVPLFLPRLRPWRVPIVPAGEAAPFSRPEAPP